MKHRFTLHCGPAAQIRASSATVKWLHGKSVWGTLADRCRLEFQLHRRLCHLSWPTSDWREACKCRVNGVFWGGRWWRGSSHQRGSWQRSQTASQFAPLLCYLFESLAKITKNFILRFRYTSTAQTLTQFDMRRVVKLWFCRAFLTKERSSFITWYRKWDLLASCSALRFVTF